MTCEREGGYCDKWAMRVNGCIEIFYFLSGMGFLFLGVDELKLGKNAQLNCSWRVLGLGIGVGSEGSFQLCIEKWSGGVNGGRWRQTDRQTEDDKVGRGPTERATNGRERDEEDKGGKEHRCC